MSTGVLLLALAGCAGTRKVNEDTVFSETREKFEAFRVDLRRETLSRGRVPGPSLSSAPQSARGRGIEVTVRPASAEVQPWNAWPDGTARLFNDSTGYLWVVTVAGSQPATWVPAATELAVNDTEQVFRPAAGPDDVLDRLLTAARLETVLGSEGDLDLRVRAADAFRQAYLPTVPVQPDREAVIFFPAPAGRIHAVAMQLTLTFDTPSGVERFAWTFE